MITKKQELKRIKKCKNYEMFWDTIHGEVLMVRDNITYLVAGRNEVFSVKRGLETGVQRFYRLRKKK